MTEINKISNAILLDELEKRMKLGQIRLVSDNLITKPEHGLANTYHVVSLNIDVGRLIKEFVEELKMKLEGAIKNKNDWEKKYKELLKSGS